MSLRIIPTEEFSGVLEEKLEKRSLGKRYIPDVLVSYERLATSDNDEPYSHLEYVADAIEEIRESHGQALLRVFQPDFTEVLKPPADYKFPDLEEKDEAAMLAASIREFFNYDRKEILVRIGLCCNYNHPKAMLLAEILPLIHAEDPKYLDRIHKKFKPVPQAQELFGSTVAAIRSGKENHKNFGVKLLQAGTQKTTKNIRHKDHDSQEVIQIAETAAMIFELEDIPIVYKSLQSGSSACIAFEDAFLKSLDLDLDFVKVMRIFKENELLHSRITKKIIYRLLFGRALQFCWQIVLMFKEDLITPDNENLIIEWIASGSYMSSDWALYFLELLDKEILDPRHFSNSNSLVILKVVATAKRIQDKICRGENGLNIWCNIVKN
jgi:hypothetical protein